MAKTTFYPLRLYHAIITGPPPQSQSAVAMHGRGGRGARGAGATPQEEWDAIDAACAASPAEAARYSVMLRGLSQDKKLHDFGVCMQHNLCGLVRCHLSTGSTPNTRFPQLENATALIAASQAGAEDVVRLLIDAGASLDAVDAEGRTALYYAGGQEDTRVSAHCCWRAEPM